MSFPPIQSSAFTNPNENLLCCIYSITVIMVSIYNILINSRRNFFFLFFLSLFSRFLNFFLSCKIYFFLRQRSVKILLPISTNARHELKLKIFHPKLFFKTEGAQKSERAVRELKRGVLEGKFHTKFANFTLKSLKNPLSMHFLLSRLLNSLTFFFSSRRRSQSGFSDLIFIPIRSSLGKISSVDSYIILQVEKIIILQRYLVHNFLETFATLCGFFKTLKIS